MTPAARVQAAIDIVDAVAQAARTNGAPADRVAGEWFRTRRFVGSKDRRAIRDLAWSAIRACGDIPATGRAAMLRLATTDDTLAALFDGTNYGPAAIGEDEDVASGGVAPGWLIERLAGSGLSTEEQVALLDRAPLDLRANRLKISREELAAALPVPAEFTSAPDGLRLAAGTAAESWPAFAEGLFEVQDTGSQLAGAALDVQPGEAVIDLCAGAGGKTLALAAAMDNRGILLACDTDRTRLQRLPARAERAGAMVETRLIDPNRELAALADWHDRADAVLIDAPCSGTGTWRRHPDARWRLSPAAIDRYAATQARLLEIGAQLVRPGGRLGYITCSLLDAEGTDRIAAFLSAHPGWRSDPISCPLGRAHGTGWRLTPLHDGTDGFFFATLRRL
ncbi:RsmB/NOP family class I SAM-dependent RNA methyltransferase [Novosphingobium lentum]|uniref:RsmB/NOP family class I SAM-dependent RNA methyltransferase n=1 Tax=Novosphingobium lentum TaxID=145287 RepID=UPI00082D3A8C|nr:RsmB/NOP family class I SAM-dependent RNA methyltransferase [Novosphingobium lentum]